MHRGLAAMYEADDRFRQHIDKHGEGVTVFLAEAIRANAARYEDRAAVSAVRPFIATTMSCCTARRRPFAVPLEFFRAETCD
jgi:TipAS antibiotic-recognition protein